MASRTKTEPEVSVRLLKHELDSWRPFADSLRAEERDVFQGLLDRVWRYAQAIESSGKTYLVEPFFLSVLLTQEERIRFLQGELAALRQEVQEWKSKAGS